MPEDDPCPGRSQTNWRIEIQEAAQRAKDSLDGFVCTLDDEGLDRCFGCGYGVSEGAPFTAWTEERVYFPIVYDGAEWVGSAPRNPCDEATVHHGRQ